MNDATHQWQRLPGALVPFDWRAFVDKHRILYRDHGGWRAVLGPAAFRLGLFAVGQLAWAADDFFDPRWRETKMRGPVFILGHQRSGTTFLHRTLAADTTHARALALHEMILPASSVQRGLQRLGAWDQRRSGKLATWFAGKQEKLFGPLDHIHRLRFDEVEEDEFVLWAIYASAMCVNDSPISTADENLDDLRHFEDWSVERQIRALSWYRACLLKKVHREPAPNPDSPPWGLSKNPAFTQKIPALLRVFPDARFIYLMRNPLETIPSRLSLIRAIWRHRFPGFDQMTPDQVRTIVADSLRTYLYAERDLPAVPADHRIVVHYRDFIARPRETVEGIYRHFGLPGPDDNLARHLAGLKTQQKKRRSDHKYSLAEFHLNERSLRERLAPVFERHDLD